MQFTLYNWLTAGGQKIHNPSLGVIPHRSCLLTMTGLENLNMNFKVHILTKSSNMIYSETLGKNRKLHFPKEWNVSSMDGWTRLFMLKQFCQIQHQILSMVFPYQLSCTLIGCRCHRLSQDIILHYTKARFRI